MLLLTACETERPMPTEDSGRIYVYSLMSDSGKSIVNIGVSRPLGHTGPAPDPHSVEVSMEADGKPVRLTLDSELSSEEILTYYTEDQFRSGQTLTLHATASGLNPAEAKIIIPEEITDVRITKREIDSFKESDSNSSSDYMRTLWEFGITIYEEAEAGDAYAVQILKKKMYEFIGEVYRPEDYESDMGLVEIDDLYVTSNVSNGNGSLTSVETEMIIDFDGGETKIENIVYDNASTYLSACVKPSKKRMVQSSYNPISNQNYSIYEYYEYKIKVYRLADEMYSYIRARHTAENHEIPIHLGFTPATYTYTNVIGGIGVFGAVAEYETDWTIYE